VSLYLIVDIRGPFVVPLETIKDNPCVISITCIDPFISRRKEGMQEVEIRHKIKEAIANVSDIGLEDIPDDASFQDDLGLDSLVLLEISVDIEMQFGIEVTEEELAQLHTIQDAVHLVQQSLVKP
jgi:acyl carrier protein